MSPGSNRPGTARIPVSTYRLQFGPGFTFRAAREIVPYLAAIGITDIYASPYFKAGPGSLSGYDIVDPNALDPRVGTEEDFQALIDELRGHGMGQVLDIVPNHLCISRGGNAWWQDILENGRSSAYANYFDIDWRPLGPGPEDKVLLPILASQYGDALEGQELRLAIANGSISVLYQEAAFPLAPETYPDLLNYRIEDLEGRRPAGDPDLAELRGLAAAFAGLPPHAERDPGRVRERRRETGILKDRLAALMAGSPSIAGFLDENVRLFNGLKGDHRSFDRLDDLLARQVWRLAHWRVSTDEINYRRFFDVNHLAAIRMEEPEVFERVHRLVLRLVEEGAVTGLRIDHTDGLADPAGYLRDLQEECRRRAPAAKGTTAETEPRPFYIVVEKILSGDESLPADWPVHGTTGYDFLNAANGLFVDSRNAAAFDALYSRLTGAGVGFADVVYEKKKLVLQASMSGEANALAHELKELAVRNRHTRDFTLNSLAKAIVEAIACFPVYRAYATAAGVRETDRRSIDRAVGEARRRNPAMSRSIFDFLRQVLLLEPPAEAEPGERAERWAFVRKFQQLTGPVMAKGVEDTAFYAYGRLVSLNEVGGRPDRFGASPEVFHAQNAERARSWPFGLITTSTHDAKRSEDVRARIDVLSEMPRAWRAHVVRWRRSNAKKRRAVGDLQAPDAEDEYLIYQTLVGAWPPDPAGAETGPAFADRIKDYVLKAVREAKVHTSWIDPDREYEDAVTGFIADILEDAPGHRFLRDFLPFQAAVSELGMYNSLSQTALKIASPGVPDIYQGHEIWDLSLVDPDNRRPVDFAKRTKLLESLARLEAERPGGEVAERLMSDMDDGRIKLFVTSRALKYRRAHRDVFERGEYLPLMGEGPRSRNVCAFVRSLGPEVVIALVSRFFTDLVRKPGDRPVGDAAWADSFVALPPGLGARGYRNVFTGEVLAPSEREGRFVLPLGTVFAHLPVALLEAS